MLGGFLSFSAEATTYLQNTGFCLKLAVLTPLNCPPLQAPPRELTYDLPLERRPPLADLTVQHVGQHMAVVVAVIIGITVALAIIIMIAAMIFRKHYR